MPNNQASRNNYMRHRYNRNRSRNVYNHVMSRIIPSTINRYVKNTRKPNNKKYQAFKAGKTRFVLTSDGFLFRLPANTRNTRNLSKSAIIAYQQPR